MEYCVDHSYFPVFLNFQLTGLRIYDIPKFVCMKNKFLIVYLAIIWASDCIEDVLKLNLQVNFFADIILGVFLSVNFPSYEIFQYNRQMMGL